MCEDSKPAACKICSTVVRSSAEQNLSVICAVVFERLLSKKYARDKFRVIFQLLCVTGPSVQESKLKRYLMILTARQLLNISMQFQILIRADTASFYKLLSVILKSSIYSDWLVQYKETACTHITLKSKNALLYSSMIVEACIL